MTPKDRMYVPHVHTHVHVHLAHGRVFRNLVLHSPPLSSVWFHDYTFLSYPTFFYSVLLNVSGPLTNSSVYDHLTPHLIDPTTSSAPPPSFLFLLNFYLTPLSLHIPYLLFFSSLPECRDLEFALTLSIDWVALSFVQKPEDILELRALAGPGVKVRVEIEMKWHEGNIYPIVAFIYTVQLDLPSSGIFFSISSWRSSRSHLPSTT